MLGALVAGFAGASGAHAEPGCPGTACITISGAVTGPMGEPVSGYVVGLQRSDGYGATATTDAGGTYVASVPVPPPGACYQVVGRSDPFYAQAGGGQKFCATATVNLSPKVRINGVGGPQKVYLPDASQAAAVPVQVSALSRSFPAPFDGQPLPWESEYADPAGGDERHDHGRFGAPEARRIGDGVWQYVWSAVMTLPANQAGFYDMDWGRNGSAFDPMMECKMIWFGYGIDSPPQKALPGGTVTLDGRRFGARPGSLVLKGSGAVTTVSGANIVSWSDTRIVFTVPPLAKTGWISVSPPSGVESNAQHLSLDVATVPLR
ncbi:MAG: IPT/TIG domain-containing protein [Actinomycetota bacterium]